MCERSKYDEITLWYWQKVTMTGKQIPGAGFFISAIDRIGSNNIDVPLFTKSDLLSLVTLMAVPG